MLDQEYNRVANVPLVIGKERCFLTSLSLDGRFLIYSDPNGVFYDYQKEIAFAFSVNNPDIIICEGCIREKGTGRQLFVTCRGAKAGKPGVLMLLARKSS